MLVVANDDADATARAKQPSSAIECPQRNLMRNPGELVQYKWDSSVGCPPDLGRQLVTPWRLVQPGNVYIPAVFLLIFFTSTQM